MRNFLRIRDGDRFWYERYLNQEVTEQLLYEYNPDLCNSGLINFTIIGLFQEV